jgi:hypothetical protein
MQTGASPANAIRASRTNTLHRQAECKTANPSDLHVAESCSSGDVHVRAPLGLADAPPGCLLVSHPVCISGWSRSQKAALSTMSTPKRTLHPAEITAPVVPVTRFSGVWVTYTASHATRW